MLCLCFVELLPLHIPVHLIGDYISLGLYTDPFETFFSLINESGESYQALPNEVIQYFQFKAILQIFPL